MICVATDGGVDKAKDAGFVDVASPMVYTKRAGEKYLSKKDTAGLSWLDHEEEREERR